MAVSPGAAQRLLQRRVHHLGGHQRRVQADRSGRGGQEVGREEVETEHELRQTVQSAQVRNHKSRKNRAPIYSCATY